MQFEVRLLGRFLVTRDGQEIPSSAYQGRRVRTLLRVLASQRASFVPRSFLVEALWPDGPPADPERNLNVAVARARRALGDPSLILTGPGGYCFDPDRSCYIDADEFAERIIASRVAARGTPKQVRAACASALQLWHGEPLAEDASSEWAQEFRLRMFTLHREALERAAEAALDDDDPLAAVALAQEASLQEPLAEGPHLLLARALSASGDRAAALAVIARFRQALAEELGLDPGPALGELELSILRAEPLQQAPGAAPRPVSFGSLAFVGRERELASLLSFLASERGGLAVVSGPSGSGKTRLLEQVKLRGPAPFVSVAAFLAERDEPWSLARILLREVLSADPGALDALPERSLSALRDIVPEVAYLAPARSAHTDPESRRALAIEAAVGIARSLARRRVALVVDDVQWADPTSLFLLTQLARRIPKLPILLALRSEEAERDGAADRFLESVRGQLVVELKLGPLSSDAIAQLFSSDELAGVVSRHTDRTPLAVAELLRTLASAGAVGPSRGGKWRPRIEGAAEFARREAVAGQRKMLVSRVERLERPLRRLMHMVTLLERPAPTSLLAAASDTSELEILSQLEALAGLGLVRLTESGWDAAHALIGESLKEAMAPEQRAQVHARIATALASHEVEAGERAHHLAASGDSEAAAQAFAVAGSRSLDSFATEEAERFADAGIALDPRPSTRSALLEIRAEARTRRGMLKEAREDLRAALPAQKTGGERSRILSKLALLISGSEDYVQAGELAELAVAEAGPDQGARARALAVAAMVAGNLHDLDRAQEVGTEALELFRAVEDAEGVADMLELKALHTLGSGHLNDAVEELAKVVALFENSGRLLRIAQPRSLRGVALVMQGRFEEALAELEQALELSRSLGHPEGLALASAGRAIVAAALGRVEEAIEGAEAALKTARRLRHAELTSISLLALGLAHESARDFAPAEKAFIECIAGAKNVPTFLSFAAARLARVLASRGELEAAQRYTSMAMEAGSPFALFEARLAQAELAAARGDPEAPAIAAEALRTAIQEGHHLSAPRLTELTQKPVSA